jgi:hypothetical protein
MKKTESGTNVELTKDEKAILQEYIIGIISSQDNPEVLTDIEFLNLSIPFTKAGLNQTRKYIYELLGESDKNEPILNYILQNILTVAFSYFADFAMSSFFSINHQNPDIVRQSSERMQEIIEKMDVFNNINKNTNTTSKNN